MSDLRSDSSLASDAASGLNFSVIVSRFHAEITERLFAGALDALREHGATDDAVRLVHVPGAYELPMAANREARSGRVAAGGCLGAVIRGETSHFDVLAHATAVAIQDVSRDAGVPIAFGLLTCENVEQAVARAGGACGNKGRAAALAAIEMAVLFSRGPADGE